MMTILGRGPPGDGAGDGEVFHTATVKR
jgi:hypothetical protein